MVTVVVSMIAVRGASSLPGAVVVNDGTGLADAATRHVVADVVFRCTSSSTVAPDAGVAVIRDALTDRVLLAERAAIDRSILIVDPGLGVGTASRRRSDLLDRLTGFRALGTRVMVDHAQLLPFAAGSDVGHRTASTVAATARGRAGRGLRTDRRRRASRRD